MKKLLVVSRDKDLLKSCKSKVIDAGFSFSDKNPDVIICVGGDGTFLFAERVFPGVPKLLVRGSKICKMCQWDSLDDVLSRLQVGRVEVEKKFKLEVKVKGKSLLGINDIAVRNKFPIHAIRFMLRVNKKQVGDVFIGDGVVLSTSFGSGGYFYSITKSRFGSGVGLAFNNLTVEHDHLLLDDDDVVELELVRGTALVSADNNPKMVEIKKGNKIKIKLSKKFARIVNLK